MKNREIFAAREALNNVDYISGKAFAYAVYKNKEKLDKEIEIINSIKRDPHPDYINFENERALLCQMFSEKNEDGSPVLNYNPDGTRSYKIQDYTNFNVEYQTLAEKYKDVLEDMKLAKQDFDNFLEKENDVELNKIRIVDLPDNITANFLEKIKFMLEE